MDSGLTPEELEGRLIAQRRVIQWLMGRMIDDHAALEDLRQHLSETEPMLDHQEDPGAVPSPAFATQGAATAELRLLLAPLEAALERRAGR